MTGTSDFWADPEGFLNQPSRKNLQKSSKKLLKLVKQLDEKIVLLEPIGRKIKDEYNRNADSIEIRDICRKNGREADGRELTKLREARFSRNQLLREFAGEHNIHPPVITEDPGPAYRYDAPFDPLHTWAVIIGINYEGTCRLYTAAKDARVFCDHLKNRGVGDDHVRLLVDDEGDQLPTRDNILNALHDLYDNANIHPGDTIIIWYSGHGASYTWDSCRIEALVPTDHLRKPDISDREVNLFLAELAKQKGNNITLILDCCFAAGTFRSTVARTTGRPPLREIFTSILNFLALVVTNRAPNNNARGTNPEYRPRYRPNDNQKPVEAMLQAAESCQRKHWPKGRALCLPSEWEADKSSHVAIYACSENETAYEARTGGLLANAMFRILIHQDLTMVSYNDLVSLIGPLGAQQKPGVHGNQHNKASYVFRIPQ